MLRYAVALFVAGFIVCGADNAAALELPKDANTTCPVMTKEEVDPDLYVDYKGDRIFLCCTKCKKRFNQNPEKYMARVKAAKPKPAAPAADSTKKSAAPAL